MKALVTHVGWGNLDTNGGYEGSGKGAGAFSGSGIGREEDDVVCGFGNGHGEGTSWGDGEGERYAGYFSKNADTFMSFGDCSTSGDQFGGGDTEDE